MTLRAGPKAQVDPSPLPFRPRTSVESERFAAWCKKYLRLGGNRPLVLAPYQIGLVASVWDADPRPRSAAWALSRGSAKSTLACAMATYTLMNGGDDTSVDLVAVSEAQSRSLLTMCQKFVMRHPDLAARVQVFKDRLVIPSRGSELVCLPASPPVLEGRNPTLTICDEGGRMDTEVFEVVSLAAQKRETSLTLLIGTPGPRPGNPLAKFRELALDNPDDPLTVYREISAAEWPDHPVDCDDHGDGPGTGCLTIANPAVSAGFAYRDGLIANLPPKMGENHFRRVILVQWIEGDNPHPFIARETWDGLDTGRPVPDGSDIVVALDGSFGSRDGDATALVIGTISPTPHFDLLGIWENDGTPDYRIPVLEVEDAIRQARKRFNVKELVADPFRWQRSLQVLESEGLKVSEFPFSPSRTTRATTELYTAAGAGKFTHSGDPTLTRHVMAATVIENNGGLRIGKTSRKRGAAKIDAAAALLMCHSRCSWLGTRPRKRSRVIGSR